MESKVYKYMDWPEIEAVVYAEEASPKDLMAPRLTADGILIQGFFPGADAAEVVVGDPGISVSHYQRRRNQDFCRSLCISGTDHRGRRKSFLCRCFLSCI